MIREVLRLTAQFENREIACGVIGSAAAHISLSTAGTFVSAVSDGDM
jgi:hypothetical protein